MIDSDAPASSLLVALEDDAGVVGGGGGGYAVRSSDGGMGALAKPASSACRLGRLTNADEEQALSGTAEGRRVVEFERAASELSELERIGQEAEEEEASAGRARREAECDFRLLEQELVPLRHEVEQLQQQLGAGGTGTGTGGGRGRKRALQGAAWVSPYEPLLHMYLMYNVARIELEPGSKAVACGRKASHATRCQSVTDLLAER
mmetsp:Transcript_36092/g.116200  ORF Transcript_36092/g.116200 Transcript_36092/m.116200 type:complete len:206 (-) Transcript_36092:7-624(-)